MDKKKRYTDIIMFSICAFCLVSIFASVAYMVYSMNRRMREQPDNASCYHVDTAELEKSGKCVVSGLWEYYDGVHLISDHTVGAVPSAREKLPMEWSMFDHAAWGRGGTASYRLVLDCVPDGGLVLYLQGISPSIQIFVNGRAQAISSITGKHSIRGAYLPEGGRCELVIEVSSNWLTGVYACPWLYLPDEFQSSTSLADSIWMASLGGFITAFLLCLVMLHKIRERRRYHGFIRSFVGVALLYVLANFEVSNNSRLLQELISFEQLHLLVTAVAVYLGITTIRFQVMLYPQLYDTKIIYPLAYALFAAMLLRLFIGGYLDMEIVITCLTVMVVVYEMICTFLGLREKDRGLVFVSVATILVGVGISMVTISSAQHFFYGMYVILPCALLIAIMCYANFWALEFAKTEEAAARESEAKQKLMDAEIAYLTSQIQPHFQYNTLTMIQELCYTNPQKAAEAIVKYSALLRRKVDFNKYAKLVPFSDELDSIHDYMAIQRLRFEDTVRFEEQVDTTEFQIPPLSIQTLVENAVHHGLRKTAAGGGTVRLTVREEKAALIISVGDNGVGFDPKALDSANTGSGIASCRFRVESLLQGSIEIVSAPGAGTRVDVTIPRPAPPQKDVKRGEYRGGAAAREERT
jgi:hypothetical protein